MAQAKQQYIRRIRQSRSALFAGPLLIALSLMLVVAGGWYTDVRRPLPNPLRPVEGLQWWFTPVERNAFMRMPVVTGDLYAVDASDDGQVIWAVGENALIIGTTDGGRTWRRGKVVMSEAASQGDDAGSTPAAAEPRPAAAAFNIIDAFNPVMAARAGDEPSQYENAPASKTPALDPKAQFSKQPNAPLRKIDQSPVQQQPDVAKDDVTAHDIPLPPRDPNARLSSALNDIVVIDARRAVAVGENGVILLTEDGGETWRLQESRVTVPITSIAFVDAANGIAVGDRGVVLRTADGGRNWAYQSIDTAARLWEIGAADAQHWTIVGANGSIHTSIDGGRSWRSLATPALAGTSLNNVAFFDSTRGIISSRNSTTILVTSDAGASWSDGPQVFENASESIGLQSIVHDAGRLIALDSSHNILMADLSGERWRKIGALASPAAFHDLTVLGNGRLVAVGESGALAASSDGGEEWMPLSPYEGVFSHLVLREGSRKGVIAGMGGALFATSDGGDTWTPQPSTSAVPREKNVQDADGIRSRAQTATAAPILDVAYVSRERVVALAQGRVLVSKDAGTTFEPVLYKRYPSPWLWVACALLLASAALLLRRSLRKPEVEQQPSSITDAAASDRPIEWGDPDPAGLRDIALGLSRFLRNRRTEPPLTIAVTGEWGTGKSSLMNLLRHDLMRYGYKPVWFNAWHHQSGENLLGSLLANIHAQGVPPLHTVAGLDFRLTLLAIRSRRFWWRLTLTLFLIAVVFFSYETLGASASKLWAALTGDSENGVAGGISNLGAATGLLGILAAVLTPIIGAIRAASAFGLQPAKLIAAVATTKHDESARVQAGARYRFAREFADFTRALDPRPLVIFIDDLDRCRAENVIEVLEAVNFLISSGRCIVVIGMARRWVETCVGLAFKELAEAHIEKRGDEIPGADHSDAPPDAATEQQQFAQHYLEKLINVEIRVPRLSDSAAGAILRGGESLPSPSTNLRFGLGTALLRTASAMVLIAIVAGVIALGKSAADWLAVLDSTALSQTQARTELPASGPRQGQPLSNGPDSSARLNDKRPVIFDAPQAQTSMGWYFGTGTSVGLALLAFIAVAIFARKESRTDDSPAFREALSILQPWIMVGGSSPRSLKRFINHVRYIAMRFRPAEEIPTTYEKLANRIRAWFGRAPVDPGNSQVPSRLQLSEELLVALATLHRYNENWLDELFISRQRDLDLLLIRDIGPQIKDPEESRAVLKRLRESIQKFNERFRHSELFENEALDRRHAIAFYEVMAFETGVSEAATLEETVAP